METLTIVKVHTPTRTYTHIYINFQNLFLKIYAKNDQKNTFEIYSSANLRIAHQLYILVSCHFIWFFKDSITLILANSSKYNILCKHLLKNDYIYFLHIQYWALITIHHVFLYHSTSIDN